MEEQKDKRVLRVELSDDVKKVSITGTNSDEKVVMRQELNEDELDMATGGSCPPPCPLIGLSSKYSRPDACRSV